MCVIKGALPISANSANYYKEQAVKDRNSGEDGYKQDYNIIVAKVKDSVANGWCVENH